MRGARGSYTAPRAGGKRAAPAQRTQRRSFARSARRAPREVWTRRPGGHGTPWAQCTAVNVFRSGFEHQSMAAQGLSGVRR